MNAMSFLISTVLDLYIMVVILRIWLQAARADFYNPFSQFVVKATQPVVKPLRRVIPSIGNIDVATVLFAYVLCILKSIFIFMLPTIIGTGGEAHFSTIYLLLGLLALIKTLGKMIFWVLIIRAIMSWVSQGRSPIEYVFHQLTEPMLSPIRRIIPTMGGLDLSVLVVFILLQFLNLLIGGWFNFWYLL